jgi:threonine dehydrogenase-like Zn-dependent dehydrogenase
MRATVYHGPREMRIDQVPDPILQAPTDVIARVTHAAICGSDLWSYRGIDHRAPGERMGHEWMGIVEEVGAEVRTLKKGGSRDLPVLDLGRHLRVLSCRLAKLLRARSALGRRE